MQAGRNVNKRPSNLLKQPLDSWSDRWSVIPIRRSIRSLSNCSWWVSLLDNDLLPITNHNYPSRYLAIAGWKFPCGKPSTWLRNWPEWRRWVQRVYWLSLNLDNCYITEVEKNDDGAASEEVVLDPTETFLDLNHSRVRKIENLDSMVNLSTLGFRNNLLKKIENLDTLTQLTELELYDNQITKIENLDSLVNLE